jgi:hypothetical protein
LRNWVLIDLSNLKFSTKAVLNQELYQLEQIIKTIGIAPFAAI